MVLALAAVCSAGFVSPTVPSRVVAAASRGPATFSMQVTGLGSETDRRPVEMIHADADKAFKFLDKENVGSIDNEMLRNYLSERDYDAELVDKIFAGIDAATDGVIDADELRSAFVKFPTLCKAIEVKPRSVWEAMDDGAAEEEIFAVADQVFTMVDTDKSGDIQVSELKALLLADDWEDALVEKVFTGIDFDDSGEIDRDELRTAFVKHLSLRSALGKQIKA